MSRRPPSYPTARFLDRCTVELRFPYNAELVDAIKNRIPVVYRTYDPASKVWTISSEFPAWATLAVDLLGNFFSYAHVEGGAERAEASPASDVSVYAVLHLQPTAAPELVDAAYRVLALSAHPDRGGNHSQMVALNDAYGHLRNRVAS
jgi:hypothetical protein